VNRRAQDEDDGVAANPAASRTLAPCLTPSGRLTLVEDRAEGELGAARARALEAAFERGTGAALVELGGRQMSSTLTPALRWWREFAGRFFAALCAQSESAETSVELDAPPAPARDVLADLAGGAPPMMGGEHLDADLLRRHWDELGAEVREQFERSGASLGEFLARLDPAWNLVGRVHFNLAENRKDPAAPFAFLATYTTRLGASGKAQHRPLGEALREYAGAADKKQLLALLAPVQRAAARCEWLRALVADRELFHPLRWTPAEALALLRDAGELERAGVVVRMPAQWKAGRPPRVSAVGVVGSNEPAGVGQSALLDFRAEVALEGEPLSAAEVRELLAESAGLVLLRGRWVEADPERLRSDLERFRAAEREAKRAGLGFSDALRLLAGASIGGESSLFDGADADAGSSARVRAGAWLAERLAALRAPEHAAAVRPGPDFNGALRPYQEHGVRWLHLLTELGLGACLADDMGLGKTVQILALLTVPRRGRRGPSLLVAPASLLSNWSAEVERFAPKLNVLVAHSSFLSKDEFDALDQETLRGVDLVVTSYGALQRSSGLASVEWELVILDEAQAIKSPGTKQARAVKALKSRTRIALTGTPIENRLGDLWSLFDFLAPGLLGSQQQFARYTQRLAKGSSNAYGPLRELVRPYILRRLKTDKSVIGDLPEKTEVRAFCALARRQAALYEEGVRELKRELEGAEGIQRRGLVLAFLMRFKQICNHPSQWLGDGAWDAAHSGKFARLREIAEVIAAKREKLLVFTQFRETTEPIARFLEGVFGAAGLVLHGQTPVAERSKLVKRFADETSAPFFVLSLKAGGVGLNLTAASHVVHFDRWWNPAVENQATDRAFRIGQRRNVLVHKFVCRGTLEERIDALLESKRALAANLLEGGGEFDLTALPDAELLRLVALDSRAIEAE
jgi:non-specific serine/threonine protein kinase